MPAWSRLVPIIAALLLAGPGPAVAAPTYEPAAGVEAHYAAPGPFAVTERIGELCCDTTGAAFDLWYPSELGTGHPIVLFGDGTQAVPTQYRRLLRHFASWGFVVIATQNQYTGSGIDILASLDRLIAESADPTSVFAGRLDHTAVGVVGHSQGASGALNAMRRAGGAIRTAITVELPRTGLCSDALSCTDPAAIDTGSVFLINGSADTLISPSEQSLPVEVVGVQSHRAYYDALTVPKVWATLEGADHNDIQGDPGCADNQLACGTGVYGFLGYPTAWLAARLRGDARAAAAFVSGSGALFAPSPHWRNQTGTFTG
ncbi:hypothetical protein [Nocardia sp. No.11]|uniref:poly(ethylene terephthalate) hydrolase family protein n=1 Tax=Nocardia sp. No.11 TaxID=3128861 RepID=UPI00319E4D44